MQASTASSVHGVNVKEQSALPAQPEVVAAYAAEACRRWQEHVHYPVCGRGYRGMPTDAWALESPQTTGVSETLRGLSPAVRRKPEAGQTSGTLTLWPQSGQLR